MLLPEKTGLTLDEDGLLACSGAVTANLLDKSQGNEPPQLSRLESLIQRKGGLQPRLITISIGGNDAHFGDVGTTCYSGAIGGPALGDLACLQAVSNAESFIKSELSNLLVDVYKGIREKSTSSRLIVVGYPNLMTKSDLNFLKHCITWLTPSKRRLLVDLNSKLNLAVKNAVEQARLQGISVDFVPTQDSLANHELCTANSWVQSVTVWNGLVSASAAHPDKTGQIRMRDTVAAAIGQFQPSPPAVAPSTKRSELRSGDVLVAGETLTSPGGRYSVELQRDGNLVLYFPGHRAVWSTRTPGSGESNRLELQADGNLVLYGSGHRPLWAANQFFPGSVLQLQDDGNLVLYAPGHRAVWASNTVA